MRIGAVTNLLFFPKVNYRSNLQNYRLAPLGYDTFERTSFTGEIRPEDVNPSRKVFDSLPQEQLTCPCCGRVMIPPSEIENLRNSHAFNCSAYKAIDILKKYENNMHSVEKEIYHMLKDEAKREPDKTLKEILNKWKPQYELQLMQTQFGIFSLIEKASENIDEDKKEKIKELIENEKIKIENGNNEFRRKYFVKQFEKIFEDSDDTAVKEHLIRLAKQLPTAYDNKNAFIVKYASRSSEEIGVRLLSYSMRTIEHVKPKNKSGENHIFNYIPECMRCNSFRSDRPMIQQLEEYPEMFANSQNLMDTMIGFANKGKLSKWYIIKIQERIFEESDGVLKLDISELNMTPKMKKEYDKLTQREDKIVKEQEKLKKKTKKEIKKEKLKSVHIQKTKAKKSVEKKTKRK